MSSIRWTSISDFVSVSENEVSKCLIFQNVILFNYPLGLLNSGGGGGYTENLFLCRLI